MRFAGERESSPLLLEIRRWVLRRWRKVRLSPDISCQKRGMARHYYSRRVLSILETFLRSLHRRGRGAKICDEKKGGKKRERERGPFLYAASVASEGKRREWKKRVY